MYRVAMKSFIKNRAGLKLSVEARILEPASGLAFLMHGLGSSKDRPHMQAFAQAFLEKGISVVLFDTTNSFGESDGDYSDATTTNYYSDLEDVIAWAASQDWYKEPFYICGHSLGGICSGLFAQKHPDKVKGLGLFSTVISGELSLQAHGASEIADWRSRGWLVKPSATMPGKIKRLRWSHMEDRLRYDLLPKASILSMPVLFIVGDKDETTPLLHQKILYDMLGPDKELHIIKGAEHSFRDPRHLAEIMKIVSGWLDRIR
jgi:pimeloyl-ACP methyl ester carboxylesterase